MERQSRLHARALEVRNREKGVTGQIRGTKPEEREAEDNEKSLPQR